MPFLRGLWRFVEGVLLPLRSLGLLFQSRQLLLLALTPLGLTFLLYGVVLWMSVHYYDWWFALLVTYPDVWYLQIGYEVVHLFAFLLFLALLWVSFTFVGTALAAPFLDLLSQRVEMGLHGDTPGLSSSVSGRLRVWGRACWHAFLLSLLWAAILPLLLLPGVGHLCWMGGTWLLLAYNFTAFSLDRRGWTFRMQWRALWAEKMATLGLGAAVFFLLAVPGVGLLVLPVATVAGTLLISTMDIPPPEGTWNEEHKRHLK